MSKVLSKEVRKLLKIAEKVAEKVAEVHCAEVYTIGAMYGGEVPHADFPAIEFGNPTTHRLTFVPVTGEGLVKVFLYSESGLFVDSYSCEVSKLEFGSLQLLENYRKDMHKKSREFGGAIKPNNLHTVLSLGHTLDEKELFVAATTLANKVGLEWYDPKKPINILDEIHKLIGVCDKEAYSTWILPSLRDKYGSYLLMEAIQGDEFADKYLPGLLELHGAFLFLDAINNECIRQYITAHDISPICTIAASDVSEGTINLTPAQPNKFAGMSICTENLKLNTDYEGRLTGLKFSV